MNKIALMTAVIANDDPLSGVIVMLVFNPEIWFGTSMEQSLISTNQVCSYGI